MQLHEPQRGRSESGDAVTHYEADASRFDQVSIMQKEDQLIVRAHDVRTDTVTEHVFSAKDQMLKGVEPTGTTQRRDVDDDLQDFLLQTGYAALDTGLKDF